MCIVLKCGWISASAWTISLFIASCVVTNYLFNIRVLITKGTVNSFCLNTINPKVFMYLQVMLY